MPFQSSSPVFTPYPHSHFPVTQLLAAPSLGRLQPVNICSASYSTSQSASPQNWTYPVGGPFPVLCSEDALRKSPVSLYSCHSTCLVVHDHPGWELRPGHTGLCTDFPCPQTSHCWGRTCISPAFTTHAQSMMKVLDFRSPVLC